MDGVFERLQAEIREKMVAKTANLHQLQQEITALNSSIIGTRRSTFLGGGRRTNGSNMGEPIRTRKEKLAGRGKHDARLGRVVQVKKSGGENLLI